MTEFDVTIHCKGRKERKEKRQESLRSKYQSRAPAERYDEGWMKNTNLHVINCQKYSLLMTKDIYMVSQIIHTGEKNGDK